MGFELLVDEEATIKVRKVKVQSADLTCDVIKKVAPRTDVLNFLTE